MDDLYDRQQRYYHLRAAEYDRGAWEPDTAEEVTRIVEVIAGLPPSRTLDVACGTGFLSQHLRGELTLLDASDDMLAIAAERVPHATVVHAEALPLPFDDRAFDRVFSSHFYDHLRPAERRRFVAEATRIASELILVQQRGAAHSEGIERRSLEDGSSHEIYKVFFTPESLLAELGGGEVLHDGRVFMAVASPSG